MSYQIDTAATRKGAPKMSPFPHRVRPFTEPISVDKDIVLGPGLTIPDLIRRFYPGANPVAFTANYGFLDRDNKHRSYEPSVEDPFVFRGAASLQHFGDEARRLISVINKVWTSLGLPLTHDKDRAIDVPDTTGLFDALVPGHALHDIVLGNQQLVMFLVANADIMKKACVVRTINAGWWAVSYGGKDSMNPAPFAKSMRAHFRAMDALIKTDHYRQRLEKTWNDASDPLDTNPGYPFFSAGLDGKGTPVNRIRTVEMFKGLGRFSKWNDLLAEVDRRAGSLGLPGHPFTVAPLRRLQPGYKWAHQFNVGVSGMTTAFDERGINSQRVAWMVPYAYNVLTIPLQVHLNTFRQLLPGCYHDGAAKRARIRMLSSAKHFFTSEGDYSNYDRYIPVNLLRATIGHMTKKTTNPSYWQDAFMHLHDNVSLAWPDYSSTTRGQGWVFKPGKVALLSGTKGTSDSGTLLNSIYTAAAISHAKQWSEDDLFEYLTMYASTDVGSKWEYAHVQSDDSAFYTTSASELHKMGSFFEEHLTDFGLKGGMELGDRFLMRHTFKGRDLPVPARVWQNTLSNETPPESEIVMLAGLAARTDGMFGYKTVDPFGTGNRLGVTVGEAIVTKEILLSLLSFLSSARKSSQTAVSFVRQLLELCPGDLSYERVAEDCPLRYDVTSRLDGFRRGITAALAEEERKKLERGETGESWLYSLHRDRNAPSSALLLEQLTAASPSVQDALRKVVGLEQAFFRYAASTLEIKPIELR